MREIMITHKPALAGAKTGTFGRVTSAGGIRMKAKPEGRLLHILASPDAGDLASSLASTEIGNVRFVSPGQWLIVGDEPLDGTEIVHLASRFGDKIAISDQTHGRVRIGLSGQRAANLLAKGTAIDLHLSRFPVGTARMTLIGHISVNLARTKPDSFELIVLRGFAESLWNDLIHMGLEYGIECTQ